jgi:WhiB family redox-sensing transcriptional regulator
MTDTDWRPLDLAPDPVVDQSWRDQASCLQVGPEPWFPEKGDSVREARVICRRCPVRQSCQEYAVATGQRFGVWGGLTPRELLHLRALRGLTDTPVTEENAAPATAPSVGVTRRRQALGRHGYTLRQIADELGINDSTVSGHLSQDLVLVSTLERWQVMYRRLSQREGPSARARMAAERAHWLPVSAWTEDTIDDPDAEPQLDDGAEDVA